MPETIDLAPGPRQPAVIGELPPAARIEGRVLEEDCTGPRVDDARLDRQDVRMLVAVVARHGRLPGPASLPSLTPGGKGEVMRARSVERALRC